MPPRTRSPAEVAAFRDQLCKAATRLYAEQGYDGVTMRRLASECGCSAMTPYRYFANKDEIFDAVRNEAFRRFGQRMQAVVERHVDPLECLRAQGREYVAFAREEPHTYRIMFELSQGDVAPTEESETAFMMGWQLLLDTIQRAIDAGYIEGEPLLLAHTCWVSLHGCLALHLSGKLRKGLDLEDLMEPLLDHFFRGAAPRTPATRPESGDAS